MILDTHRYPHDPDRFDDAVDAVGDVRPSWSGLERALGTMETASLLERQRQADRLLDAEGAGHLVHELRLDRRGAQREGSASSRRAQPERYAESSPWRLDPLPLVIDAGDFAVLAQGLVQRMRLFELLLADLYGPRSLMASGVVPSATVVGSRAFRFTTCAAPAPKRWLVNMAIDLARDASGRWHVVQDLTDAPSGLGYTFLNRSVVSRLLPDAVRSAGVAPVHDHADVLRRALTASAPSGRRSPRCVVLSGGPAHPSYIEHSYLATQLGYHLAEGADVVMRQGRLWLRALDGLEPLDVVYRRIEDALLDPLEPDTRGANGVPGIVWGAWRGGLTVANAYGSGLVEEQDLWPHLADACAQLLGEPLRLPMLPRGAVLATTPVFTPLRATSMTPASVVVRLQAVAGPDGIVVMPGGAARVLAPTDDPRHPTAELVKDVWVLGGSTTSRLPLRINPPPQVDFGTSVSKRAADSLYWLGRAAERAEVAARAARVVSGQLDQDPALLVGDGGYALGIIALLRAAQARPVHADVDADASLPLAERVTNELRATSEAAAAHVGALVNEAMSVREYLSTMMGRVLGRLTRVRADLLAHTGGDDLDVMLVDLAALSGLAMESTVRGPAWRFLDLGRRIERALAVLGTVEASLGRVTDPFVLQPLAEAVLSSNESLVAFRRRYRSDVDLDAVLDLLIHDDGNPRSLAFQLDRVREHVAALGWHEGVELVHRASTGMLTPPGDAVVSGRRSALDSLVLQTRAPLLELGDAVVRRWFADPVNPMMVRGRT